MKKLVQTIKQMMHKEYCLCIYREDNHTERMWFVDFELAVRYARSHTTIKDQYEVEMLRNGRWRWTTKLTVGGHTSRWPRKGGAR